MKWCRKWWWLIVVILAIALVIGWEEERCQAQADECRTSYAAQMQSERLSGNISIDQQASEQQAIAAACEPKGYFCRLFAATNLPTMLLVFIGIGATWAALRTLGAIKRQEIAMRRQALIMSDTARRQLRAYMCIPTAMLKFHGATVMFEAQIHAQNKGQTPAYNVDHRINVWIGSRGTRFSDLPQPSNLSVRASSAMLGPNQEMILTRSEDGSTQAPLGRPDSTIYVYGIVIYDDAFGQERWTRFCYVFGGINGGREINKGGERWGVLQTYSEGNEGT